MSKRIVHFSMYRDAYDADSMKRVPSDIETREELMDCLKERGQPLDDFKKSAMYKNSLGEKPWLRDI